MGENLKETKHDYQNCLVGNFYDSKMTGIFDSWGEFKNNYFAFAKDDPLFEKFDDTYHFFFRYDIYKQKDEKYTLELCVMLQRKGIYSHLYIKNITEEDLNGEIKIWLKGRLKYLKGLWAEINTEES